MTVSESARLPKDSDRAPTGVARRGDAPQAPTASKRVAALDELADAIERTFLAEHVFVAADEPEPLVVALWRRAVRAMPASGVEAPAAYDLVVVPGGSSPVAFLGDAVFARTSTILIVVDADNRPDTSLLSTIEYFAERSFEIDPIADVRLSNARTFVFRRAAEPLPATVRRAYASLLNRSDASEREAELTKVQGELAAAASEATRARRQAELEHNDRLRTEAELARVVGALAEANEALSEQLASTRAARISLDRDIVGLSGSPLWHGKLAISRLLRRGAR